MYQEEFLAVTQAADKKIQFSTTNPFGYFLASMLAGAYVGIGILLIFSVGGALNAAGSPFTKIAMGLAFGIALSLVIIAGSELFTGNVFVMTAGLLRRTVRPGKATVLMLLCYAGNLAGSILTGVLFYLSGLATGATGTFIASVSETKMSLPVGDLFFRAVLCNILVCLAVWSAYRLKSESAKLIMVFWCLFAFITTGLEHSVANMTLLTIALLAPAEATVSLSGYLYNILIVTLGNIVGASLFLAIPYHIIAGKKKEV